VKHPTYPKKNAYGEITKWTSISPCLEGGCTLPDYAWNDWGKAQTDRVLDLMDIDYLRLAQAGAADMPSTRMRERKRERETRQRV